MSPVRLLGVEVHPLTMSELNRLVATAIATDERWIIANHNLHSVYLYQHDWQMKSFYRLAKWVHVDGMSLIVVARLLGLPLTREHRVTYADWVHPLMGEAARFRWRVFYLGSRPGVGERAAEILRRDFPDLHIATEHGYFSDTPSGDENVRVLARIRTFEPDILMVGMGMPRQEHWILQNHESTGAHVILTVGACMDYVAGVVRTPPRWLGRIGLEWIYRLVTEPKRLARRYLVEPWSLLPLLLRDLHSKR